MVSFTKIATLLVASASAVYGLIPVTGATQAGGVQARREIRTLYNSYRDQFDLYIQAVNVMFTLDPNNGTSWYQIMGIHGTPNGPWDGIGGNGGGFGFCPHSNNMFATWHRPYVALYEQQLVNSARAVALFYPASTRTRYTAAANLLRAPYYDAAIAPASGKNAWPDNLMNAQTITVQTPAGQRNVQNPLYTYTFQRQVTDMGSQWATWPRTLRYPTSTSSNAGSNDNAVTSTFNQLRDSLRSTLYAWFVNCRTYVEMNDDNVQNTSPNCGASLESFHNNIHVYIGGGSNPVGHMTQPGIAAFDAAFMLHHCNIDRLFAMWQVIYPNAWVTGQNSRSNTYAIPQGAYLDANSALAPFRDVNGNWLTANSIRNVNTFSYTYPELQQANGNINVMTNIVNVLYSSTASSHAQKRSIAGRQLITKLVPDNLKASNGSTYQYYANVETSKYKLNGTFSIYFFIGGPTTTDSSKYSYDPNLAGTYNVLAGSNSANLDVVSSHQVPLSGALLDKVGSGLLSNLTPFVVGNYLQKALTWKVIGPQGTEVDPASIPNFKVTVYQGSLTPITDPNQFPVFSTPYSVKQATTGKSGGYAGGAN